MIPGRFDAEIQAFALEDKLQPPPLAPVLFYGSSSIRLWGTLREDFPDRPLLRRGFGGSTLAECVIYCNELVVSYAPSHIVFYAGDNDLADGASPEDVLHRFQQLVHRLLHALGPIPLTFIAIKPSPARWDNIFAIRQTNALVAALIEKHEHLRFLDIFDDMITLDGHPRRELYTEDNLHMNREGYSLWARRLREQADF